MRFAPLASASHMCCSPAHLTEGPCGATVLLWFHMWLSSPQRAGDHLWSSHQGCFETQTAEENRTFRWAALGGKTLEVQPAHVIWNRANMWSAAKSFGSAWAHWCPGWSWVETSLGSWPSEAGSFSWEAPSCYHLVYAIIAQLAPHNCWWPR